MLVHALLDAIVVVRADVAIHVHHVARYARHRVLTRVVILAVVLVVVLVLEDVKLCVE